MGKLIAGLTLILLFVSLAPLVVFANQDRWYAHSRDSVSNLTGLEATIETADPNVESGHSLETIWILGPSEREWLEVGWLKGNDSPRMYSYCSPDSQCLPHVEGGFEWYEWASPGSSHTYRIEHDTENQWKIYINDVLKRTVTDAGFSAGVYADTGGEVTDPDSDIGVSGLLSVKYEINDDGVWRTFDGTEEADEGFWIIELGDTKNNMQNGTCWHEPGHC